MEYTPELCTRLISHFTFEPGEVPPGFSGFRAREGMSLADFRRFCEREDFAAAVEEARARYLDTLTAGALLKQYDTGFVKHLLSEAKEEGEAALTTEGTLSVEIRVVE